MTQAGAPKAHLRMGGWLPHDPAVLEGWLKEFHLKAKAEDRPLHPVIEAFARMIDEDPVLRLYFNAMIDQVPRSARFRVRHLKSLDELYCLMNFILTYAPPFEDDAYVGCPLDAVLDWCMGTPAGFAAFRLPKVNAALKAIMGVWCEYLTSPASLHVIRAGRGGWKSKAAQTRVGMEAFAHDPGDPHWGFTSWNDFFTRRLAPGARPIADPDDPASIVSPCEATPYRIARDVAVRAPFWIKRQPYSLHDMLRGEACVQDFVGGTVWQAFLSAFNYHRWHSPVSGTVLKTELVEGTYFSEAESEGEDPVGPNNSQPFLAHVATRAIIHIEADHPGLGRLVVMPIGMGEISSCVIDPRVGPGARIEKGQELGYFQYGGSTLVCVFRKDAIEGFSLEAIPDPEHDEARPIRVNALLARAKNP